MNQHVQAVENALSGERTFHTINFPATGDDELDCMNALISVINQFGKMPKQTPHADSPPKRVLLWFFARTAHIHGLPLIIQVPAPTYPVQEICGTTPVAPYNPPPGYTTSGGTGPLVYSTDVLESMIRNQAFKLTRIDPCNGLHDNLK